MHEWLLVAALSGGILLTAAWALFLAYVAMTYHTVIVFTIAVIIAIVILASLWEIEQ
jgi:hypothetical protein